jgi:hypothetical protein
MTAPDDGLEQVLRQALSSAAGQVEPGDGGLERILVRIGAAPPRPRLSSVAAEALRRVRHWTWRGHWAWQDQGVWHPGFRHAKATSVAAFGTGVAAWNRWGFPVPAARPHGPAWMRLVAGLAVAASITAVAVAVPPVRAALVEVSSGMLTGGNQAVPPGTGGAGGPGGTNGSSHRDGTTAAVSGARAVRPSGSPSRAGAVSAWPSGTLSSQSPCTASVAESGGSLASPTISPSAVQASVGPVPVPSAVPLHPTPTADCPTATGSTAGQPTQSPRTSAPPSPITSTSTQATVPPATAPPSSGAPSPTDSPTPTPTPGPTSGTDPGVAEPSDTGTGPSISDTGTGPSISGTTSSSVPPLEATTVTGG